MQITFNLPDNLELSEDVLRLELAIALFQQKVLLIEQAANLIPLDLDDFHQLLIDRKILTPPNDPDDTPDELILANLRLSLQDIQGGRTVPLDELWDGIDD